MKIAYITAGAGNMYCGSCIRDNALAAALQARGHEALLLPVYTPVRTDEESVASERIFYGAINVYLEQKLPVLRRMPEAVHRWLARPGVLRLVASAAGATDARGLGDLTLSMLAGEEGRQARELEELAGWLAEDFEPEVVHLTNSMLLGLVEPLKRKLGVPVLCSLQGEDIFLDELDPAYRQQVREALRAKALDADALVATSRYYAGYMTQYLNVPPEHIAVARIGINVEGHAPSPKPEGGPLVVGYMARVCPEKGLHRLVDAFRLLVREMGESDLRLRVAGYLGGRDRRYFEDLERRVREWGLEDRFEYLGEVDREAKIRFLQSLDVLSVPTEYREPKGLFVLEALANGVPVVLPEHGAFPELLEATGGGLLVEPGSAEALAAGLETLLCDPSRREELGRRGLEAVRRDFTADAMAAETEAVYQRILERAVAASSQASS